MFGELAEKPRGWIALGDADHQRVLTLCMECADYFQLTQRRGVDEDTARELLGPLPASYAHGRKHVFGFEEDGQLMAIAEVLEGHPTAREWFIGLLLLRPVRRGQGTGSRLARGLRDWIAGQGATAIRLVVQEENPRALAFWQRTGFSLERSMVRETHGHEGLVWILRAG